MSTDNDIDPEARAYSQVLSAIKTLDLEAQQRVVRMCAERLKISIVSTSLAGGGSAAREKARAVDSSGFQEISDLFDAASHEAGMDRVLLASYWLQVCQGQDSFASNAVNDALKNLGYASSNITRDFDSLKSKKPSLVLQVQKQGTSKQARKLYKLTRAGIDAAEKFLASGTAAGAE